MKKIKLWRKIVGTICLVLGVMPLLTSDFAFEDLAYLTGQFLWIIILIVLGLYLLLPKSKKKKK